MCLEGVLRAQVEYVLSTSEEWMEMMYGRIG